MKYCFDTNIIIDLRRRLYPPEIFPGIWTKLEDLIERGIIISSDEVFQELGRNDDEVLEWAKKYRHIFLESSEAIQLALRDVLAKYGGILDLNKNKSNADPYVIAVAKVHKCTVVTNEKFSNNIDKPKIPDVCKGEGMRVIGFLDFVKDQGWIFI